MQKSDDLIKRYLYDVVHRLPEKQREDIELELKTLIEDMTEERMEQTDQGAENIREKCVREVLTELGSPRKLARRYRQEKACLISGENYDSYCFVLKIVLVCVGFGMIVSRVISIFVQAFGPEALGVQNPFFDNIINFLELPMALVQAFGFVTLIYAVLDRMRVKVTAGETEWDLEKLPQIPYEKAVIHKGDCITGIVFCALAAILFIAVPQLMGAWVMQDGIRVSIPLFNLSIWNQILPLFLVCFAVGIIDESVKLTVGRYSSSVMIVNIISNLINASAAVILFKVLPIWNPDFGPHLQSAFAENGENLRNVVILENGMVISNIFTAFVILCCMIDIGITVFRTLRYGSK